MQSVVLGGTKHLGHFAFLSHPQLLSLNAASGPNNWNWLVEWVLSSTFKITQLFSFLKNKTNPGGGWEFPTVPKEAEAQETGVEGKRKQGGRGGGVTISQNQSPPGLLKCCGWGYPWQRGWVVRGKGSLFLAVLCRRVGVEGQGTIGSLNVGPGRGPTNWV